jgi:hypothetical protein
MNRNNWKNSSNSLGKLNSRKPERINIMKGRIAPALLLGLLLTLTNFAIAQKGFTDNFEIKPFWTIVDHAGTGSVILDSTLVHGGIESVQVSTDSFGGVEALSHSFPSPLYGTVSVWVYYSNVTSTGYKQLDIFDGPAFSESDYLMYIDWGDLRTYVRDSSGATTLLAHALSTGWHNWTFSSVPGGVKIKIDGVKVLGQSVDFAFQTVNLQQCCLAGSAFFDDFKFIPAN